MSPIDNLYIKYFNSLSTTLGLFFTQSMYYSMILDYFHLYSLDHGSVRPVLNGSEEERKHISHDSI